MAEPNQMFRKAALEKLASPEQLDVMMQITSPRTWLALYALGGLVVLVILWSIFGKIPTKVAGQGILIRGDAVLAVTSPASGQITEFKVRPGDQVKPGDVVAVIGQSGLELRIANQRQRLATLIADDAAAREADAENLRQSLAALEAELASVRQSIVDYQADIAALTERLGVQEQLVQRGLLTRNTVLATRSQLNTTQQAKARAEVRIAEIATQRTSLERGVRERGEQRVNQIEEAKRQLVELEGQRDNTAVIRSPFAGRVLEMTVSTGDVVGPGRQVLTLENEEQSLEAFIYVAAMEGKKIRPGMEVRVSPSTVKAEEYGFMKGEVRAVSDFPVSGEALNRVLRNQTLVESLSAQGAPVEVIVKLKPADTPSGFEWSSSQGPPAQVYSGTMSTAQVVVEERRPISLVIPIMRSALGAGG